MPRNTIVTPNRHVLYISLQTKNKECAEVTEILKNIDFFVLLCKIMDSNNLIGKAIRGATIYPMNYRLNCFGLVCHSLKIVGFIIRTEH